MIAFIVDHREAYGVEPICRVLPIAPSSYRAHAARRRDPSGQSVRAKRDAALKVEVRRVFEENFPVYGARKVWRQLLREGFAVVRCTVQRLMRAVGLQGAVRGKPVEARAGADRGGCSRRLSARRRPPRRNRHAGCQGTEGGLDTVRARHRA